MIESFAQSALLSQASVFLAASLAALAATRGAGVTLCPIEAAESLASAVGGGALSWRDHVPVVRGAAIALARCGELVLYRDGRQIDPDAARGMFRIGLPNSE
jgi:Protein of unknown function (DUF3253)